MGMINHDILLDQSIVDKTFPYWWLPDYDRTLISAFWEWFIWNKDNDVHCKFYSLFQLVAISLELDFSSSSSLEQVFIFVILTHKSVSLKSIETTWIAGMKSFKSIKFDLLVVTFIVFKWCQNITQSFFGTQHFLGVVPWISSLLGQQSFLPRLHTFWMCSCRHYSN